MKRIKVSPPEDYYVAFLNTRGISIVHDNPDVIHYFGTSYREVKKMAEKEHPDLTIIHDERALNGRDNMDFVFVFDRVSNDKEIYRNDVIVTNAPSLAKVYYGALGLNRRIVDVNEQKKKEEKRRKEPRTLMSASRIFDAMLWK